MKLKTKVLLSLTAISTIAISPLGVSAAGNQALLLGRNYGSGEINTTVDVNNAQSALALTGKTLLANTNPTISWVKGSNGGTARMESDILFFSGHGNSSLMHFYNASHSSGYDFYITTGTNSSNNVGLSSYSMSRVDLAVFANDDRSNTLSINVVNKDDNEVVAEIGNWINENLDDNFSLDTYEVDKTVQEDKTIYDLKLLINGDIKTKLGYTVFIYDDVITNIFDNMNGYTTVQPLVQVYSANTTNYSNIVQEANRNIDQLTYEIVNQESYKYYDDDVNKLYYEVRTELKNRFDSTLTVDTYRVEI